MPHEITGTAPQLQKVLEKAKRAARSGARVLLTGETGTGKELLARRIHAQSRAASGPFVAVNCAGLSAALLESALFGHVKGAFTTAHRTHEVLAAAARGGTLFLDEVSELPFETQAKLLRFVETGEFCKVGATQTETSDARIICASNVSLESAAGQGAFREDLYYRLAVVTLCLPPLRERRGDILPLALRFLCDLSAREGKAFADIDKQAQDALCAHDWPGNIRALQNAVHAAVALHDGETLTRDMLDLPQGESAPISILREAARPQPLARVQEAAIEAALEYCGGNIPKAARLLEVSPSTLYRRLTPEAAKTASS